MVFRRHGKDLVIVICVTLAFYSLHIEAIEDEDVDNLLAFFDKPQLPLVHPKTDRYFELPKAYYDENYQKLVAAAPERDSNLSVVKIKELTSLPALDEILSLDRNEIFSMYNIKHRYIAGKLIDLFMNVEDIKDLISLLSYVHHRVNPYLFIYALSVTLMNRPDTKGLKFPNIVQVFPDRHFKDVLPKAGAEMQYLVPKYTDPIVVLLQRTPDDFTIEQKMAYFREDIGANLHHWHWHLAYPHRGNLTIVERDRRGELFYYMHHQVVARYNFDRLCNNLNPVEKYSHWIAPVKKSQFPNSFHSVDNNLASNNIANDPFRSGKVVNDVVDNSLASNISPNNNLVNGILPQSNIADNLVDNSLVNDMLPQSNMMESLVYNSLVNGILPQSNMMGNLADNNLVNGKNFMGPFPPPDIFNNVAIPSGNLEMDLASLIRHRERICKTIDLGYAEDKNGSKVELNSISGIDILGNMVESNEMSPNYQYYGDMHNYGHLLIADLLEPGNFESSGVMREPATAMRDPIFYRWHSYINGIFEKFKETLPPYTAKELNYPGIKVTAADIKSDGEDAGNVFNTFWSTTLINLKHGLNFLMKRESLLVKYNHLQHRNFTYSIVVENENGDVKQGTCRVFMSPAVDESSKPWGRFADQRHAFIEMDKFKVELQPGTNVITRNSTSSTVTIPFERTFYDVDMRPPDASNASQSFHYSGCGWPHHLLVPKGTEEGYPSQLFVMITNYEEDEVEHSNINKIGETYCGIRGSKYPDKRAMGYPFDRLPREDGMDLKRFLTPNMFVQDCTIKHSDVIVESKDN